MTSSDVVVAQLWRYPVKSMQGERLPAVEIQGDGMDGDRRWGVRDERTGRVLTGRREARLLEAAARLAAGSEPVIELPDGTVLVGSGEATDTVLSDWLGRPVRLVEAGVHGDRAEYFADPTDDASEAIEWTMPPERFVDAMPLLLMTTASLRAGAALHPAGEWDVRRFRPNVLLDAAGDGWLEDDWCGRVVRIGEVDVVPQQPCVRCTMVTRSQPGLAHDLDVYRTLARHHGGNLGVWTAVRAGGTITENDAAQLVPDDLDDLRARAAVAGIRLGAPFAMERDAPAGRLRWRLSLPEFDTEGGIIPFFIDWRDSAHPSDTSIDGLSVVTFGAEHPDPGTVLTILDKLSVGLRVSEGPAARLVATLRGPAGDLHLG